MEHTIRICVMLAASLLLAATRPHGRAAAYFDEAPVALAQGIRIQQNDPPGQPPRRQPPATQPVSGQHSWADDENADLLLILKSLIKDDTVVDHFVKDEDRNHLDVYQRIRLRTKYILELVKHPK